MTLRDRCEVSNTSMPIQSNAAFASMITYTHYPQPKPSREALDRLWERHDRRYGSADQWREAMKQAIMAWVSGEEPTPVWCCHISLQEKQWMQVAVNPMAPKEEVPYTWDICPVKCCHAKRPE